MLFESANEWVLWKYDDTEHLSIAYNFLLGNGLTKDFIDLEANTIQKNIPALQKHEDISSPLRSKLPLYFVLLSGWLFITSSNVVTWYFYGSILNLILSSVCIVVFYFFVKRNFGAGISLFSVPLLAMMPSFVWYSVRIRPDVLAFIFIILSIHYAAKKITYSNAVVCGVFISLAHLSHPIGLIPGSVILIYFLMKKRLKESAVLVGTWCLVSAPWLIRNYLILGDATQGFGIPIPRSILGSIGLISPNATISNVGDIGSLFGISIVNILEGMLKEFSNLYGMNYFLVLVTFSIVAYINIPYLKNILADKNNRIVICAGITTYTGLLVYTIFFESDDINIFRQTIILFLVPLVVFIYIKAFSKHKNIFSAREQPAHLLIGLFVVVTFIPYIMFAQIAGREVPEIRIIIQSLYLLIPLALLGIWKILNEVHTLTKAKRYYLIVPCVAIIFFVSYVQMYQGINQINSLQESFAEKEFQKDLDTWLVNNLPKNATIASDLPHAVLLKTGYPAVNFPHLYKDNTSYEEWIIKKFDIDYLVFYYFQDTYPYELLNLDLDNFYLQKIYQGKEGGLVYKVSEKP